MIRPHAKLVIFASGNGRNAEAIMTHFKNHPDVTVALLLSNNPEAFALARAEKFYVPNKVFTRTQFKGDEVLQWLKNADVTHIVLAGFLWLIPNNLLLQYPRKIVNIHPALLPKFGGKGMYGMNVHEAVKAAGELETGITIHLVNDHFDKGEILFQARCTLTGAETPEAIAHSVYELEIAHYPAAIEKWIIT